MLLGLLPKDQDKERNKRTNSDVGLVVRTTVGEVQPKMDARPARAALYDHNIRFTL